MGCLLSAPIAETYMYFFKKKNNLVEKRISLSLSGCKCKREWWNAPPPTREIISGGILQRPKIPPNVPSTGHMEMTGEAPARPQHTQIDADCGAALGKARPSALKRRGATKGQLPRGAPCGPNAKSKHRVGSWCILILTNRLCCPAGRFLRPGRTYGGVEEGNSKRPRSLLARGVEPPALTAQMEVKPTAINILQTDSLNFQYTLLGI